MCTIEYIRRRAELAYWPKQFYETRRMTITRSALSALLKYSAGPDGGRIFGDAWLVRVDFEEF
jgi:hypothetical protein